MLKNFHKKNFITKNFYDKTFYDKKFFKQNLYDNFFSLFIFYKHTFFWSKPLKEIEITTSKLTTMCLKYELFEA